MSQILVKNNLSNKLGHNFNQVQEKDNNFKVSFIKNITFYEKQHDRENTIYYLFSPLNKVLMNEKIKATDENLSHLSLQELLSMISKAKKIEKQLQTVNLQMERQNVNLIAKNELLQRQNGHKKILLKDYEENKLKMQKIRRFCFTQRNLKYEECQKIFHLIKQAEKDQKSIQQS